ncbi:MAG: hypothetical protein HOV96_36660 [Nonomuraea sp.]|nr:hypothetical protein [Nonomuraea sp.]NUP67111.1 hypothetical protein [Nonomuraea sp.]NUP83079.1 hypothetical protein [Nonomuraea sp.]NUS08063.1 hypothetical protein [Nonomuraea sp.]NUT11344.1 hypothetical protein [Nonomuraea sp.]
MKRLVLAWVVTAVAATGAAVAVLGLLGTGVTGTSSRVLSGPEVRAALATATPRTASAPPATSSPAQDKLMRTPGGTVIASCSGGQVTLRSWSPAQGYKVDGVEPGPAAEAKVEFEPEEGEEIELKITCTPAGPVARSG